MLCASFVEKGRGFSLNARLQDGGGGAVCHQSDGSVQRGGSNPCRRWESLSFAQDPLETPPPDPLLLPPSLIP